MPNTPGNQAPGRGFAGFGTLVSDVEKDIAEAKRAAAQPSSTRPGADMNTQARPQNETTGLGKPQSTSSGTKVGGESQSVWWVLIGVVAMIAWIIATHGDKASPPVVVSPPTGPAKVESPPAVWDEAKPAEGVDRVLSFAEVRYCVAEDIRLKAMDGAIDRYRDYEVDGFNNFVTDYNARCGSFKYRTGSLQSVQSDAANRHEVFEQEGRLRALALHPTSKTAKPHRIAASTVSPVARSRPQ